MGLLVPILSFLLGITVFFILGLSAICRAIENGSCRVRDAIQDAEKRARNQQEAILEELRAIRNGLR